MKFSIVIPCYNEEENLKKLVSKIEKVAKKYDLEFILVENGSKDNSRKIFESIPEINQKEIKSVYVDENCGYGYGLLQGLKCATGDFVGWIHADLQVDLKYICGFMDLINCNSIVPSKVFLKGKRTNRKMIDIIFTACMSVFETLLFRKHLYDIGAIPVLFSRDLLGYLKNAPYDFSIELFTYYQAKKNNFRIIRKKVVLKRREKGKSSWDTGFSSKIKQSIRIIKASILIWKQK